MANSKDCSFLPSPRILTRGRFLVLVLGLLALSANSMADVTFDGTNLTGSGTYSSNISASGDLISKATDTSSTITLSNNTITASGEYYHDLGNIVFDNGTTTTLANFNVRGDNASTPAVTIDGTFTCNNFVIGKVYNSGASKGVLYITNNANITARGYSPIGNYKSAQGTVYQSGGTITFTNEVTQQSDDCIFRIGGYEQSTGTYNLSGGILNCLIAKACVGSGKNTTGTFTITGGTANLKGLKMTSADGSKGTLNLYGGELKIAGDGVTKGNGTATINMGQGTVSALANHTWNSALTINLNGRAADSTANVANGQTTFNSDGKTITLASKLTGVGALVKNGSGNLVLSNTGNSFTGDIIINNGQLTVSGQPASNKQSSTLGNLTTSGRKIVINNGATLSMNGSQVFGANGDYANIALDIDGGTLSNDCNSYNKIYNLTFRNGSTLHIANGDATWQGVILFSNPAGDSTVNILKSETRNSTDPVRFTTSGAANANLATRSAVFNVQDITNSANGGSVDNLSDLIVEVPLKVHSTGTCVLTKDGPGTMELTAANSNNGSTTILAGTLKLSGAGTLGAGAVTNSGTLEFAHTGDITISNVISGTGAVTKTGSGTLTLSGANTYTGATTVSNGELVFSGSTLPVSTMTATGGTLVLGTEGNSITAQEGTTIKANGGSVRVDGNVVVNSGKLFVSGVWTGDGSISVEPNGQFRISDSFTYPKGITLNGGLLMNAAGNTLKVSSPVTVATASNVQAGYGSSSGQLELPGGLYGSGDLTVNNDSNLGWVKFSGAGNYEGSLTLIGKILTGPSGIGSAENPADASDYIGSKEIQFKGGTLHNYDNVIKLSNDLNFVSNSSIMAGWSKDITLTGKIKGSGNFIVTSDSGWVIAKTETQTTYGDFTGAVQTSWESTSKLGKLKLGAEQPFGPNAGQGRIYGQLDMNGFSQVFKGLYSNTDGSTKKGSIFNNNADKLSTLTLDITGYNDTYQGVINGNIELVVNSDGAGVQTFNNNGSTFTGNVVINGGKVVTTVSHASHTTTALGAFSTTGGRTITVNPGAELSLGTKDALGGCTISNYNQNSFRLIINGGKLSGTDNNGLYNATFQNGAEVYGNNNRDVYRSFWLMGTNTVSFAGDGLTPESPVQFNGAASDIIFVPSSATLNVADITLSDASDLIVNVSFGNKSESLITTNSVTKTGAGTMEFTKANTYDGGTTISGGTLKLTGSGTLGTGDVTNNGTLEFGSTATITPDISGAGNILVSAETVTLTGAVNQTGGTTTLADGTTLSIGNASTLHNLSGGSIGENDQLNPATLTVNGDLTLNNDAMSTFIGSITAQKITVNTENNAALKIYAGADNKVTASSLTVSSGELDLKGYFEGNIEVFNGSVFSPGNSVGTADITGNITFADATADSNGVALFEFGEYADGADVNHDLFVMENGGIFTADDGVILLDFANNDADSWATEGNTYLLVSGGGFADGDDNYANWLASTPDYSDLFKLTGIDGSLYLVGLKAAPEPGSGVPEPSTWALLALGVVVLFLRKRK